jgi:hypothetical protein
MTETIVVDLPSGRTILFGGRAGAGLGEVGLGGDIVEAGADAFRAALGTLGDIVAVLEESVGRLAQRPDKIEIEFRASLSGKADLWIVAGDGEAEFTVKLAWEKEKPAPPPDTAAGKAFAPAD